MRYLRHEPLLVLLTMVCLLGCERESGHDHADHEHEHEDHEHEHEGPEPVSVTEFTPKVLLFMEYPRLIRGQTARFLAHVTVLETGEPVRSGSLMIRYTRPDGEAGELVAERPARDGLFIPQGSFERAGTYQAQVVLRSDQVGETVELEPLVVYADTAAAKAADADAEPHAGEAISFLLEQQWKIGTQLRSAERTTLVERIAVAGEVEAIPGGLAAVSAPIAGRLARPQAPGSDAMLPRIGERVEVGRVLGRIEPPLPPIELALRQVEIAARSLEIDRDLEQAAATLEYAAASLTRQQSLRERGLGTDEQLEKARHDLRLAQAQHKVAEQLKASFEKTLRRFEGVTGAEESLSVPLIAPIAGQVVSVEHVEGEHLEAGDELLRIVDNERVWVVAHVPEAEVPRLSENPGAVVVIPGASSRDAVDILASEGGRLVNIGAVVDPITRTVPVRYELANPRTPDAPGTPSIPGSSGGRFRIGMGVEVRIETGRAVDAVTIPESGVVMDGGRPTAYVMLGGETFAKRDLRLGGRDRGRVEVLEGIAAGEWVVTRHAYAIKLAAQAPASMGHGHVH